MIIWCLFLVDTLLKPVDNVATDNFAFQRIEARAQKNRDSSHSR